MNMVALPQMKLLRLEHCVSRHGRCPVLQRKTSVLSQRQTSVLSQQQMSDPENIHPVSTEDITAGRLPAAVLSSVETGWMSSVEIGEMSAAETGLMSAAETGQMSAVESRRICPVSSADTCPVTTADFCPVPANYIFPISPADIWLLGCYLGRAKISLNPSFLKCAKLNNRAGIAGGAHGATEKTPQAVPRRAVLCVPGATIKRVSKQTHSN